MLLLAALIAAQARTLPTLGRAQPAALPAPDRADLAARRLSGAACSASFVARKAILLACHPVFEAGIMSGFCFRVVAGTMSSPVVNPHEELPSPAGVNLARPG